MAQRDVGLMEIDGKTEIVLSQTMTISLLGKAAFMDFERTPRKRGKAALNLLFHKARENGYTGKENFLRAFKAIPGTQEDRCSVSEELSGFLDMADIKTAMQYVKDHH
jgi:hypothetical protein